MIVHAHYRVFHSFGCDDRCAFYFGFHMLLVGVGRIIL
jgi:hypothetical protein